MQRCLPLGQVGLRMPRGPGDAHHKCPRDRQRSLRVSGSLVMPTDGPRMQDDPRCGILGTRRRTPRVPWGLATTTMGAWGPATHVAGVQRLSDTRSGCRWVRRRPPLGPGSWRCSPWPLRVPGSPATPATGARGLVNTCRLCPGCRQWRPWVPGGLRRPPRLPGGFLFHGGRCNHSSFTLHPNTPLIMGYVKFYGSVTGEGALVGKVRQKGQILAVLA